VAWSTGYRHSRISGARHVDRAAARRSRPRRISCPIPGP
jgi:hypothetical protein